MKLAVAARRRCARIAGIFGTRLAPELERSPRGSVGPDHPPQRRRADGARASGAPNHVELCVCWNGGAEGNRTPDLYNAIVALSQLSYGPSPEGCGGRDSSAALEIAGEKL
ncbi:MAG: hypothetical protein K0S81_1566 [Rhodospirillales bacterium]|nr:hypothetical protein [Rhodospirillales bacterium]